MSGGEQEKNGSYFKSKFNPTIHPSNLKFNYLRKKCEKLQLKTQILGWMVGCLDWLDKIQITKRVVHSDTHRERSHHNRSQSERSHHNRNHSDRTLCPAHEGRTLQAWRMCVCVSGDEQEKNGSYFKSKFNPTIQPSNLKFNYLRNKCKNSS